MIHTFLDPSVESQLESFLSLIIFFLVHLKHLPLPSLIVTSSQVRVGMPLPLLLCSISGMGPEGLRHNPMLPVVSPSTSQGDPCIFLGETLPTRTFHAKLNGQSAVSTRRPTTLQHLLEKQVTSSRTWCGARLHGPKSNAFNLILKLFLYHFLHTMSL